MTRAEEADLATALTALLLAYHLPLWLTLDAAEWLRGRPG